MSIHYDEDGRFWGRVKDTTSFCMKNRKVTLRQFRIQKIEQIWISTPFYEFFHEAVPGTDNYVVANRKEQHFRGHDHVCKMSFSDHLYF